MILSPTLNFLLPCGGVEYIALSPQPFPGSSHAFLLDLTPSYSPVLSGKSVLLPELWSKERRESFPEYFVLPTSRGKLGRPRYLSAASPGSISLLTVESAFPVGILL